MLTKKDNLKNEVKSSKPAKSTSQLDTTSEKHTSCCQPTKTLAQPPTKAYSPQPTKPYNAQTDKKTSSKTRVIVKYDAGFPNQLYIRGKGANLSWDKGLPLKNIKPDEWMWETDANFNYCEFKILINDRVYENGDNHHLNAGSTLLYTPHFY
jgi:hypothetical protein